MTRKGEAAGLPLLRECAGRTTAWMDKLACTDMWAAVRPA